MFLKEKKKTFQKLHWKRKSRWKFLATHSHGPGLHYKKYSLEKRLNTNRVNWIEEKE